MKPQTNRIPILDIIRGFALLGIFMVNLSFMVKGPAVAFLGEYDMNMTFLDVFIEKFNIFFFQGKFINLFSILFGYGFYLFLSRFDDGKKAVKAYIRRLLSLLVFGILHVVFLFSGDILIAYALLGFVLLLAKKLSDKAILRTSILLTIIPFIVFALSILISSLVDMQAEMQTDMSEDIIRVQGLIDAYSSGSFTDVMSARIKEHSEVFPIFSLSMFFLGSFIARKGYLNDIDKNIKTIKTTAWVSLIIGLVFNFIAVVLQDFTRNIMDNSNLWATVWGLIGGISFAIFYPCMIILIYRRCKEAKPWQYIAAGGRMALTNYIIQSIIMGIIVYPYGLGLFEKLSPLSCMLIVVVAYLLQLIFSKWWLTKHRFGPIEWLWKLLTYGAKAIKN